MRFVRYDRHVTNGCHVTNGRNGRHVPIGRRVPLAAVSPIGARLANGTAGSPNATAVSPNGRRVTHHRVSLMAAASSNSATSPTTGVSLMAAVSLITGMSLTAAASPIAPNGCCAIGIVTYKMQFDSEICAIYTLQTSQTRLASPRHEASQPLQGTERGERVRYWVHSPRAQLALPRLVAISDRVA